MPPAARTGRSSTSGLVGHRPLPNRNVTAETIDDAYPSFILYCNPAIPQGTDTTALRDSFRALPKSGGKSFDAFNLFLLVRQLELRELKTWADVALKLGVDPPDREKGESPHKVQSYTRWMHAMHVDAFFEFLMGLPHPYWTAIPTDPNPIQRGGRDGVAPVDDMALRALIPQLRPKPIRKRADDAEQGTAPPSRRRRTAQAQGTAPTPLPPAPQGSMSTSMPARDIQGEKCHQRRYGAKVVSSAWRSRGLGGTGTGEKGRGRPRSNESPSTQLPFSGFPTLDALLREDLAAPNSGGFTPATSASAAPTPITIAPTPPPPGPPPRTVTIHGRLDPRQNAESTGPPFVLPNIAPPVDLTREDDVDEEDGGTEGPEGSEDNGQDEESDDWKKKYEDLLREVQSKDKQLEELKATLWRR
ncbi:hypothetical protein SODALDRAFT_319989 [Sodiomyces alkalinus F11]|uniref:Uncharacterized protein n=1 Tax=Sodiomyces alkalinus (strain CBS 110278 / VKM F-3762 / F11) TaxID=1314773 RepID=A0A3N2QA88_SODAK|nr:hypothetical protein SODALDRAFT_319989 [Sodiomyces alkalinus F11]ROT43565.1 hypothetical protein SODALDRAFT_319989 [Sodiomyces alkalinus F11]